MIIAPSILAADFAKLGDEVNQVLEAGADWIHVDVMDGQFVPNLTMGPLVVEALRRVTACPLDVHLMIQEPERYVDAFVKAGASTVTIHAEATLHVHRALEQIRELGVKAGLALNPATSLEAVRYVADVVDLLLIMTVNPGFGGQAFIPATVEKVARAKLLLSELGRSTVPIEVDGGITAATIAEVHRAGADIFVAGSAIFGAADYAQAISNLRAAVEPSIN